MRTGVVFGKTAGVVVAIVAMVAAMALPSRAAGANPAKSEFYKYEKCYVSYDVNADGTYVATHETLLDVLTDEGVKPANHTYISYSESLEEAVILAAYTLKKDGRRIDVPPANIQERAALGDGGPMFSDIKAKHIIFPDVAAGDKVGYSYRVTQKVPLYPGHFSFATAFSKTILYDDVRISVSVPRNTLDLKAFAVGVQGGRLEDRDGRGRWVWTYANHDVIPPEPSAIDPVDYGPRVFISSFTDYGALAAAYEGRARPKAAVTPRIRALAAELTKESTDRREEVKALYSWVVQNIHYAGNSLGVGSVVPHDAEVVLDNKLGDCKDHTTLLEALLAARGIESTPVLVNANASFRLPEIPAGAFFNHVILYVPSLDLYVDSTSETTPFGLLPVSVSGKPVVHTAPFDGIRHTPPTDYRRNRSLMRMTLRVHEDGSADGESRNEETGLSSGMVRSVMSGVQPSMEDLVVRGILASSGQSGTGTLTRPESKGLAETYAYGLAYHLESAAELPGPAAIRISPILPAAISIQSAVGDLSQPEPTLDYACLGGASTEEYTIELPASVKVMAVPKDVHIAASGVRYDATYRLSGTTVTATRTYEEQLQTNLCTPEYAKKFRPIARAILKDLKAQVIYQPAE